MRKIIMCAIWVFKSFHLKCYTHSFKSGISRKWRRGNMKQRGGAGVKHTLCILDIGTKWMVSGQLQAPAILLPGNKLTLTHWIRWWVDPRAGVNTVEKSKISCPYLESNPSFPVHSPSPYWLHKKIQRHT
jgi:hypothetical protein